MESLGVYWELGSSVGEELLPAYQCVGYVTRIHFVGFSKMGFLKCSNRVGRVVCILDRFVALYPHMYCIISRPSPKMICILLPCFVCGMRTIWKVVWKVSWLNVRDAATRSAWLRMDQLLNRLRRCSYSTARLKRCLQKVFEGWKTWSEGVCAVCMLVLCGTCRRLARLARLFGWPWSAFSVLCFGFELLLGSSGVLEHMILPFPHLHRVTKGPPAIWYSPISFRLTFLSTVT